MIVTGSRSCETRRASSPSGSGLRMPATTVWPARANTQAVAKPIPLLVPVTSTVPMVEPPQPNMIAGNLDRPSHLRHDLLGQDLQLVEREAVRHPRPMDRGDDVVDAEATVQPDHLLGDLRRRAKQETVLQEFIEFVVEIVAFRHDLVLAPVAIGPVFLFEIGLGAADRLGAASADEHLAAHRHLARKRLALFVE